MFSAIIYVLATTSLFVGSVLTFENELPDYFYMVGTSLFLINSVLSLFEAIDTYNHRDYEPLFEVI